MPKMKNINSSLVKAVSYNKKESNLKIRFVSNGETVNYIYHKVSLDMYMDFIKSESKGKFFLTYIKNKFDYTKCETFLLADEKPLTVIPA